MNAKRERPSTWWMSLLALAMLSAQCAGPSPDSSHSVQGDWRGVLESPGGELPFWIHLEEGSNGPEGFVINGTEHVPFTSVEREGETIVMAYDHYDSAISATISINGNEMRGLWVRQRPRNNDRMVFHASREPSRDPSARFGEPVGTEAAGDMPDVSGEWDVVFTDEDGKSPARAELEVTGSDLRGTFLTPTGDYRFLAGDYRQGSLRLSCFDGAHAFLFHARVQEDGSMLGDFWSRGTYHATWVAKRTTPESQMPDPFQLTTLENPTGRLRFSFPDLDGSLVSLEDERFTGKVVLVEIFGSWCPNCNDAAPVLVDLYERYRQRGLEIVGLAYEMTGERDRDALFVRKFAERHGVTFPLLLAGTSDKALASETLPDLSGVLAFPTLVFIGRDGRVESIHTGFSGPATGEYHTALKARYTEIIENLL